MAAEGTATGAHGCRKGGATIGRAVGLSPPGPALRHAVTHAQEKISTGRRKGLFNLIRRLWLSDEGIARRHAPELHLLLEVVGHEGAAVVVAEREAAGGAGGEMAELPADGHAEGLGGLEAGAGLGDVPAEEFGIPVL